MNHGELAFAVGTAVDPTSLMQRVADRTVELIDAADRVAIGLMHDGEITYVCGAGLSTSPVGTRVDADASLSGLAVTTGEIQRSDDTRLDIRVDAETCVQLAVRSLVCVPLTNGTETYGVMAVNSSSPNAFDDHDVAMLQRLAGFVSVAIGSARDIHRTTLDLLELSSPTMSLADGLESLDESTRRYMMGVLDPDVSHRLDTHDRIREVLEDENALHMVVQPVVDLSTATIIAVEALARFRREPVRPPDEWFGDAHRAGLGVELELLAVERALDLVASLPAGVSITINVGPETVSSLLLGEVLARVPANRVVLELTEHTAFDRHPQLLPELTRLRRRGVRLAVDDAGSGYSSLTHILQLAPDFIKLDRDLIAGLDTDPVRRALVSSLVTFAGETGARIIAEGIETSDELAMLDWLGVRYAQGYFLGRPTPVAEVFDEAGNVRSSPVGRMPVGTAVSVLAARRAVRPSFSTRGSTLVPRSPNGRVVAHEPQT